MLTATVNSQGQFVFDPASLLVAPGDIVAVTPSGFSGALTASASTFNPGGVIPVTSGQVQNLTVIATPLNSELAFTSSTGASGSVPVDILIQLTATLNAQGQFTFNPTGLLVAPGDIVAVTPSGFSGTLTASASTFSPSGTIAVTSGQLQILTVIAIPSDSGLGFTSSTGVTGSVSVVIFVVITLDSNGQVVFSPTALNLRPGDTVGVISEVSGTLNASCSTFVPSTCGAKHMNANQKTGLTVKDIGASNSSLVFTTSNNATGDIPVSIGVGDPSGVPQ
jgi:plastocyanin